MRKLRLFIYALVLPFFAGNLSAQADVSKLIKDFSASDWNTVKTAKYELENLEKDCIDGIIAMLDDDEFVKLTNYSSPIQ